MTDPSQQVMYGRPADGESEEVSAGSAPRHASGDEAEAATTELPATEHDEVVTPDESGGLDETSVLGRVSRPRRRGLKPRSRLRGLANATTGTWIGVVLVAAGFAAIFYTWGKVAGVLNVAEQLPYLVSGGIAGLALVIVGATVIDVAVRRQDGYERRQQLAQMTRTLDELRDFLEATGELPDEEPSGDREWESQG